jgi:hypothetical protein
MNFYRLTIEEPIFSVSNTEFEGGGDGHGLGDHTFLVKQAQPSHTMLTAVLQRTQQLIAVGSATATA